MSQTQTVDHQISTAVNQNATLTKEGLLERTFGRMFRGLVYAQIWEDPVVDIEALRITPDSNLICIASGGCNVMSYLTANPASITAVDLSPAHVALNKTKLAAAQYVPSFDVLYDLFGHADKPGNVALFDQYVLPHLDDETQKYWNDTTLLGARKSMFRKGLYRHGALGRFIGAAHFLAWFGRVDFKVLLKAKSLAEQNAFFEAQIAPMFESRFIQFLTSHRASLFGLGIPPAQYEKLAADADGYVIPVLRERTRKLFCDFPISENYFAWQAANRGYDPSGNGPVPPYLERRNFDAVRANAACVTVLNRKITDVLNTKPDGGMHGYVLLDAQDWMNDDQLNELWSEITRTADVGATVIFRTGGLDDILPGRVVDSTLSRWDYDKDASRKGTLADRSAIYGAFHVYRFKG